jgi:hypothetical protein
MGSNQIFKQENITTTEVMDSNELYCYDGLTRRPLRLLHFVRMLPAADTEEIACYFFIDAIILRNLSNAMTPKPSWRTVRWTQLDEQTYYVLVDQLRTCVLKGEPFWKIEQHWTVTDGE